MVALVLIHMVQVFLFGAFKFPRELTWIVGVFLLLADPGHGLHRAGPALRPGRLLGARHRRVDRRPRPGRRSGGSCRLMLGGPIIAGATLTRFFALHVFVIPGLLIALVGLHLLMVLKLGINDWPMPGRLVRRADVSRASTTRWCTRDGVPFVRTPFRKDLFFAGRADPRGRCAAPRSSARSGRAASPIPTHHPDRPEAGLLLPLALLGRRAAAAVARDARAAGRAGRSASSCCSCCRSVGRGREELAPPAGRRPDRHPRGARRWGRSRTSGSTRPGRR